MALSAVADEVVLLVLQFLDSRSLARCEAVCRRLQALCPQGTATLGAVGGADL